MRGAVRRAAGPAVVLLTSLAASAWCAAAAVVVGCAVASAVRRTGRSDAVLAVGYSAAALLPAWQVWRYTPGLALLVAWLVGVGWAFSPSARVPAVVGAVAATWLGLSALAWAHADRLLALEIAWVATLLVLGIMLVLPRAPRRVPEPPRVALPPNAPGPPAEQPSGAGTPLRAGVAGTAAAGEDLRRYALEHLPPSWTRAMVGDLAEGLREPYASVRPGTRVRWRHRSLADRDAVAVAPVMAGPDGPIVWVTSPYNWAWHERTALPVPVVGWSLRDAVVPRRR